MTLAVGKYIEQRRNNPELNCPDFCRVIVLDDAGEWRKSNTAFMADMTRLDVHVIVNPKGDKRLSAFAEGAVQKMKLMVLELVLSTIIIGSVLSLVFDSNKWNHFQFQFSPRYYM